MSDRAARSRNPLSPWLVAYLVAAAGLIGHRVGVAANSPLTVPEIPSVEVLPPQCNPDSFPMEAFLDALRVELAGTPMRCCRIAERSAVEAPSPGWSIELESAPCANTLEQMHIKARSPGGTQLVEREISLGDVAQAIQPRTLALVAAELIRTIGPGSRDTPRVPIKPPEPTPRALPPASERPSPAQAMSVHFQASARHLPTRDTTFWGGRARWSVHRGSLRASLDWGAEYAHAQATLGDLHLSSASLGLGVGPRFVSQSATIDLGIRAELGMVWVRGSTGLSDVRIDSGTAAFSNLGVWGSIHGPAKFKLRPELTVEAGGVIRGVDAQVNRQTVAGMAGYYMLIALGITMPI